MKVGDLVRGKSEGYTAITWCSEDLAIVTHIKEHPAGIDVTLTFTNGEEVLMEKKSIMTLFEVISPAP